MKLKDILNSESGFKYCIDNLNIQSSIGRAYLLNQKWMMNPIQLQMEWDIMEQLCKKALEDGGEKMLSKIQHKLSCVHNIKQTIINIENKDLLDDVQFFEIKNLAILGRDIALLADEAELSTLFLIPDLSSVLEILDPDNNNIAHFYVYESYDERLQGIRSELKALTNKLNAHRAELAEEEVLDLESKVSELFVANQAVEDEVREILVEKLMRFTPTMYAMLERLAYIDVLIAKVQMARDWKLCKPSLSTDYIGYTQLVNPRLKHLLEAQKQPYQPIDITIKPGTTLITGANMAGKTVILKTMAIAQLMAQFGFYVPADEARIELVDKVVFSIGDEQNEMNGLSSFASEIIKIDSIVKDSDKYKMLVLIDEPARTTNPLEGKAIVQAIASHLDKQNSYSLITTHYSHLGLDCRKMRVKGFIDSNIKEPITPQNINKYMDYSLQEDSSENVPHEALRIAQILNCDSMLIDSAKSFLENIDL